MDSRPVAGGFDVAGDDDDMDWERLWAPHDEATYQEVLTRVQAEDVVLEIGAGDLRLSARLAGLAKKVYALEINPACEPIAASLANLDNLHVICADAYTVPFPADITLAVLLMRHCQNVGLLADKVQASGGRWLFTNARWGLGVELIDLLASRVPYSTLVIGWFACWCGATGFVPGPAEQLTQAVEETIVEVIDCPACKSRTI